MGNTRTAGRPPRIYGPSPSSIHVYGMGASGVRSKLQTLVIRAKSHKDGECACLNCTLQRSLIAEELKAGEIEVYESTDN